VLPVKTIAHGFLDENRDGLRYEILDFPRSETLTNRGSILTRGYCPPKALRGGQRGVANRKRQVVQSVLFRRWVGGDQRGGVSSSFYKENPMLSELRGLYSLGV